MNKNRELAVKFNLQHFAAKPGTTTTQSLSRAQVREIDFVSRFAQIWTALQEIMGIADPIKATAGGRLVSYEAKAKTGLAEQVGEGEEVTATEFEMVPKTYGDVTLEKFRKSVTAEAIHKYGYQAAVQKTDNAFLNLLQGNVMDRFYDFIQTGELTGTANNLQQAVARAVGKVKDKFKKLRLGVEGVAVFVNTMDVYEYLGTAQVTIQTQFGFDYVEKFLGADIVFLSSEIPSGKVIATPVNNIVMYYLDPEEDDLEEAGLEYRTAGDTNLIGVHVQGDYSHVTSEIFAIMGITLWAEYIDGISVITIGSESAGANENAGGDNAGGESENTGA